jgi:hypothetical protein
MILIFIPYYLIFKRAVQSLKKKWKRKGDLSFLKCDLELTICFLIFIKVVEASESLENVVRILSLLQIEKEQKENNDRISSELENLLLKSSEKKSKANTLNHKKRMLAHLNNLIDDEERKIEEANNLIAFSKKEISEISSSCLSVAKSALEWLNEDNLASREMFSNAM